MIGTGLQLPFLPCLRTPSFISLTDVVNLVDLARIAVSHQMHRVGFPGTNAALASTVVMPLDVECLDSVLACLTTRTERV